MVDANVLLRRLEPASPLHAIASAALSTLRAQNDTLYIVPQSVYEFWAVATRPIAKNGLGPSAAECAKEVTNLKASFLLLDDKPPLFVEWEAIVTAFACLGKVAHDARYVAAMRTHGLTELLTFNVADFTRYPGITVLDPRVVASSRPAAS